MSPADPSYPHTPANDIDEIAADWLGRRDGGLPPAEEAVFKRWLAADRRHAAAYARLEAASHALDALAEFRPAGNATPDPDQPLRIRMGPIRSRAVWLAPALAAAAAIVVGFVTLHMPSEPGAEWVTTEIGGVHRQTLADGSRFELNTDSAAEFAYTARERRITLLRGEALFTVASDPDRPFIVNAGGVDVRAVGTAFNVRLHAGAVDVLVTEGRVRVDDSARGHSLLPPAMGATEAPVLSAGQRAVIPSGTHSDRDTATRVVVVPVDLSKMSRLLAWKEQRLEFEPTPLREVVAEFNRYNRHQLVVADVATGALSIGGSFRANDHETFVRLLESSFGIVAERGSTKTVLHKQP